LDDALEQRNQLQMANFELHKINTFLQSDLERLKHDKQTLEQRESELSKDFDVKSNELHRLLKERVRGRRGRRRGRRGRGGRRNKTFLTPCFF
jgi:hypothetical protein